MKVSIIIMLAGVLFISSCSTYKYNKEYPTSVPTQTGQVFSISNQKKEMLFDVTAPTGVWVMQDWTKNRRSKALSFRYKGPNYGMINALISIKFTEGMSRTPLESKRKRTSVASIERSLKHLTLNPDLIWNYRPINFMRERRQLAGLQCRYYSYDNHPDPKLDGVFKEFHGLESSSFQKQERYRCAVMRDGKLWFLTVEIFYEYSEFIAENNLNIGLNQTIKDFDSMLAPTLKSLKLYGDLKQY